MKQGLSLIATIPSIANYREVLKVVACPSISEVRFNTGSRSPYPPIETVKLLKELAEKEKKKLWIDIKGRQLRVDAWADPLYECVELNHSIKADYPAKMAFRNGTASFISSIDGNKVFLMKPPREALGKGQSVNIIGSAPTILDGYLTKQDVMYLEACKELGIKNIMASFVEQEEDIDDIKKVAGSDANICAKIESQKGLGFIVSHSMINLMAARDDLYIELEANPNMMFAALKTIVTYDPNAICASRIFTSLERRETPEFSDYEDLEMMYQMGYRKFMLCDNVCNYAFDNAIKAWEAFLNA